MSRNLLINEPQRRFLNTFYVLYKILRLEMNIVKSPRISITE
jgi:hypothetical protein